MQGCCYFLYYHVPVDARTGIAFRRPKIESAASCESFASKFIFQLLSRHSAAHLLKFSLLKVCSNALFDVFGRVLAEMSCWSCCDALQVDGQEQNPNFAVPEIVPEAYTCVVRFMLIFIRYLRTFRFEASMFH